MKKFNVIFISIVFLMFSCENSNNNLSDKMSFNEISKIQKIVIVAKKSKLEIVKNGNGWIVNNKFTAQNDVLQECLNAISGMKISSSVTKNEIDSVTKSTTKQLIVFGKNNKKLHSWKIGTFDKYAKATNVINENEKRPYLVNLPGVLYDLNIAFSENELYWVSKTIFNYKFNEISKVKIEYFDSLKQSFILDTKTKEISNLNNEKHQLSKPDLVARYLSYFEDVKFTEILSKISEKKQDSIVNSKKICEISVFDKKNKEKSVILYPKYDFKNNEIDKHRVYVYLVEQKQFVIVKYFDIDLLMKNKSYFTIKEYSENKLEQ